MSESRPPTPVKLCEWSRADEDTDMWETGCDNAFVLNEGTPSANKFKFCPYCGGTLRTARKDRKR